MQKIAILTFTGLACGAGGMAVGYFFLKSIDNGANYIFLIVSLVLFVAGVVCLILATKPKKSDLTPIIDQSIIDEQTANALQQNNATLAQWNKTNDTRDRLKILKIAGADKEDEAPQ